MTKVEKIEKARVELKLTQELARHLRMKSADEHREISEIVETLLQREFAGECISSQVPVLVAS